MSRLICSLTESFSVIQKNSEFDLFAPPPLPRFNCPLLICLMQLFRENLSGIRSKCQTVWIQTGLIWVQIVCKKNQQSFADGGHQTMTLLAILFIIQFDLTPPPKKKEKKKKKKCMVCASVREDNPRALESGLSPVQM